MPHDVGESGHILDGLEQIPDEELRSPEEERKSMSLEEATSIVEGVVKIILDDVGAPFTDEALSAAAIIKAKSPDAYARLKEEIVASSADTNEWSGLVKDRVREQKTRQRRRGDHRPVITDSSELHLIVEESCQALEGVGGVYERGGELVEIIEGMDDPEIYPIAKGRIREILSRAARYEKLTSDGAKSIKPPPSVVESIYARSIWGLPRLKGFVDGAVFLTNGDILSTQGYHPQEELYVRRASGISGLRNPTREDAIRARKHLIDLLVDFELVEDERAAHESAWLSALLTILARPAIEGCTPFFLFDANRPRVGKTRLAEMANVIATGRCPTPQAAPAGRDADSEMQKTITGIARSGTPVVFFDNVKGKLGGPSLELAITARRWSARILGESRTYEGRLMLTWIATSNNCQLTPDMHGRTLLTRIKSNHEAPEKRTNFKYPNIMRHVRENRAAYLKSALTILRAWHVDGRPNYRTTPWGSFEEWGEVIRNSIIHAGGADPCDARGGLASSDNETMSARAVLENWPINAEFTSSELAKGLKEGYLYSGDRKSYEIIDALDEFLSSRTARGIGYQLGNWEDRIIDGRVLVREKDSRRNIAIWVVKEVKK